MKQLHTLSPFYCEDSRILILGSFPSVKSRETGFYYGHPQNRFWRVLAAVYGLAAPQTAEQKCELLRRCRIALWDVIGSCEITGSSDSSIRDATPNEIGIILSKCSIDRIFTNGKTADRLYGKYIENNIGRAAVCLPSTSPANASKSLEQLISDWSVIRG